MRNETGTTVGATVGLAYTTFFIFHDVLKTYQRLLESSRIL
jgi:hypothetical protein